MDEHPQGRGSRGAVAGERWQGRGIGIIPPQAGGYRCIPSEIDAKRIQHISDAVKIEMTQERYVGDATEVVWVQRHEHATRAYGGGCCDWIIVYDLAYGTHDKDRGA